MAYQLDNIRRFIWCGDSWVFGDELDRVYPGQSVKSFAQIVSQHFDKECLVLAENKSSISHLVWQLRSVLDQLTCHDMVFFGLSGPSRTMMLDQQARPTHILPFFKHNELEHLLSKHWYKYFDTEPQQHWQNDNAVDLVNLLCQSKQAQAVFFNIFSPYEGGQYLNSGPKWLFALDQSIANFIMKTVNTHYLVDHDNSDISESDWQEQKQLVDRYIRPCWQHPNQAGHQRIADRFIDVLANK